MRQPSVLVQFAEELGDNEVERLDALLRGLVAARMATWPVVNARWDRFGFGNSGRYVLQIVNEVAEHDTTYGVLTLYALERTSDSLEAREIRVRGSIADVGVERISDADADGLADVVYCVFDQGQQSDGRLGILGFRDGHWYDVLGPRVVDGQCRDDGGP